jgi:hypothetical protein
MHQYAILRVSALVLYFTTPWVVRVIRQSMICHRSRLAFEETELILQARPRLASRLILCGLERQWTLQMLKSALARLAHVVAFVARIIRDASGVRNGVGQTKRLCFTRSAAAARSPPMW